jgi:hypothetical protein
MKSKSIPISLTTAMIAVLAIFVAIATADQHSGTWKMNPAKSKYSPGPAPKSLEETVASDENSFQVDAKLTTRRREADTHRVQRKIRRKRLSDERSSLG